jgi:3D (Asp-Asp-Asp) domain-containing protein
MIRRANRDRTAAPVPRGWIRWLSRQPPLLALYSFLLLTFACVATVPNPPAPPPLISSAPPPANNPPRQEQQPPQEVTRASWYGPGFDGHRTATGERFSSSKMTAAAKDLPLGSRVVVTNLKNGRSATVRINDCGPFRRGRKIDLSKSAARKLGLIHDGTARVKLRVIKKPLGATACES